MYQNLNNTMNPLEEFISKKNTEKRQDNLLNTILILGFGIAIGYIIRDYQRADSSHIDIDDFQ